VVVTATAAGSSSLVLWQEDNRSRIIEVFADVDVSLLRDAIARGLPGEAIQAEAEEGRVVLTGTASSPAVADQIAKMAAPFSKEIVNSVQIALPHRQKQILLKVRFAQVDRTKVTQFGINLFSTGATNTFGAITTQQFGRVSYIKVPYFEKGTAAQFRAALENVRKNDSRQLIVDLRGNAGGDIDEAIAAADELLTSGLITSLEGRRLDRRQWQADRSTSYDGAVEVLQDNATAAGAEIFAAAIHGNGRGKTVGITTYGRSIVQKLVTLPSGGAVYMTVGHYTSPDLKPIKDGGVKPGLAYGETDEYCYNIVRDPVHVRGCNRVADEHRRIALKAAADLE